MILPTYALKLLTLQLLEMASPPFPLITVLPERVRENVWDPMDIGALTVVIPAGTLIDTAPFEPDLRRGRSKVRSRRRIVEFERRRNVLDNDSGC